MLASSLVSILCSTTSFKVGELTTEPASLIRLFRRREEDGNCHIRLIKHLEHPVAYTEGPDPPEEVEAAQSFLVHNLCVGGPLQLVVLVDSEVPLGLENVHVSPINADRRGWGLVPPEVHQLLLHLLHVQLQFSPHQRTYLSTRFLY